MRFLRARRKLCELLGIVHRTIKAIFNKNSTGCQTRKRISTKPTTLGDWLHLKRIEMTISQSEVAEQIGVAKSKVRAWEHDELTPTDTELQALSALLPMGTGIPKPNPTAECSVGNCTVIGGGS